MEAETPLEDSQCELERLWKDHHAEVHRFIAKRAGATRADDILADTFVEAARAVSRGCDIQIGWLMTVARRRLVDSWRRSERNCNLQRRLSHLPAPIVESEYDDTFDWLIRDVAPRQQRALILRYQFGFSLSAIAADLGASYRATESLIARAKKSVERELSSAQAFSIS